MMTIAVTKTTTVNICVSALVINLSTLPARSVPDKPKPLMLLGLALFTTFCMSNTIYNVG